MEISVINTILIVTNARRIPNTGTVRPLFIEFDEHANAYANS